MNSNLQVTMILVLTEYCAQISNYSYKHKKPKDLRVVFLQLVQSSIRKKMKKSTAPIAPFK